MHLFKKNANVELYNILQIIRIRSESGEAIESLIKSLSEEDSGKIPKIFKKVIKKTEEGMDLDGSIDSVMVKLKDGLVKNLLMAIKMTSLGNVSLDSSIDDIENQILSEQKMLVENFLSHTDKYANFIMYVLLFPFLYLIMAIINWISVDFFENGQAIFSEMIRIGFFVVILIMLIFGLLLLRFKR